MTRFWNRLMPIVAARATVWPSQHEMHGGLLDEIRELSSDADAASMQAAFWRKRAIELGASEDEWRRWSEQDQAGDHADHEADAEPRDEHEA